MKFLEAMEAVGNGNRVCREAWGTEKTYVSLLSGYLSIRKEDGIPHTWIISRDDFEAEDWKVWEPVGSA